MIRVSFLLCFVLLLVSTNGSSKYSFPEPVIEVFRPKGVTVTLAHTPADRYFAFNANINRPIDSDEVGDIAQDASKREKGRWVLDFPDLQLKNGDKLYYRMFVNNGPRGYRKDDGVYLVQDSSCPSQGSEAATICERVVVNLTQTLLEFQQETASMRNTIQILENILEKDDDLSRTLLLEGLNASDSDSRTAIQAIIDNKLGLTIQAANITRAGDGKFKFQVKNLREKLLIVKAAEEKLKNSRYKITV